ncbi:MAG: hydrogenase expression/formation protein HypE [Ignavibacteria bacterium]|nr:hydrogenase expression/formation protein HypE [Ignavibacteria bacterium]
MGSSFHSEQKTDFTLQCPIPINEYPNILLAHGGGGKLMHNLIEKMFSAAFSNEILQQDHDSAQLTLPSGKIAFTTDSYVVQPLFFPGGDIGSLAINGTVNDLAMSGAKPLYLSLGLIIEEGFAMSELWKVVQSLANAAKIAGVKIATGDTKVVERGKGDGIFINTSGIGIIEHSMAISPKSIREGDVIILNGDLGRHGIAIMAEREGLQFEHKILSDCAPLNGIVKKIIESGIDVHCMRDLTRGGLSSTLNELAGSSPAEITIDESLIPVHEDVRGACEILGFDPMYVANEGKFIVVVNPKDAEKCLSIMKGDEQGKDSVIIGSITGKSEQIVKLKSKIGTMRILDMLSGEQLPRIC